MRGCKKQKVYSLTITTNGGRLGFDSASSCELSDEVANCIELLPRLRGGPL